MSKGIGSLTLHCQHITGRSVHCNRYKKISIKPDETPREAVKESGWSFEDGRVVCEEHKENE